MATTNINVRVDADLKKSADDLFEDLGLTMSSAISMFLKCAVNNNGIPFEIKRTPFSEETKAALAEFSDMKNDLRSYKRYDSFDDVIGEVLENA